MSNKAVVSVVVLAAVAGGLYLVNKRYGEKLREILRNADTGETEVKEPLRLTHEKEAK